MTGVMIFLLGIVSTGAYDYSILLISGQTYWGSLIVSLFEWLCLLASYFNFQNELEHVLCFFQYIIAGSLSVAAQNKLNLCVVRTYNVINSSFLTLWRIHTLLFIVLFKCCIIYTTKNTKQPFLLSVHSVKTARSRVQCGYRVNCDYI